MKSAIFFVILCLISISFVKGESITDKIPKSFYPFLRKACELMDKFLECMVERKAFTQEEADGLKKEFMEEFKVCPFDEDDDKMKEQLAALGNNQKLMARLKSFTKHLRNVIECAKKVLFKLENLPKSFYPNMRSLCFRIDEFKNCMVKKGAVKLEKANKLVEDFNSIKICPLPESDDEMEARLKELSKDEAITKKMTLFTKYMRAAGACLQEMMKD